MKEEHAKQIIEGVIEDSARVYFTHHAKDRMLERDISRSEVNAVLRHGEMVELPALTSKGSYKATLESYEAGRQLQVAIDIDDDDMGNKIIIITVIEV